MISLRHNRSKVRDFIRLLYTAFDPCSRLSQQIRHIPRLTQHYPCILSGARAYYLHSILHDWSDADCLRVLSALKPALEPEYSRILVQEMVVPDKGAQWQLTSLDWGLMQFFSGRERSESEWRKLIEQVDGLKVVQIFKHALSVDSVIEIGLA